MTNFSRDRVDLHINSRLSQFLLVSVFSMIAAIAGVVPNLATLPSTFTQTPVASAQSSQEFSEGEILNYARAVLAIEPKRQQTYDEIRQIIGESVPVVVCNETGSLNRLKQDVRVLATNYCSHAKKMIEDNNLTVARFNEITRKQQSDAQLQQRIQAALLQLQQPSRN
ncbi:DUF4168 domain-containing protein [Limnoraphis robusta]|uniref:DUF4168 domain-containing protein n=1 Tax=Limnoraphis robusta CCNP1315 TaxID=3110306 RepID=A0ABU5U1R5_9CYAN|nr:DUF4168 domain-containing protein [Limnoraphis robusta]MEA5521139.1 DUF4168 domain-containing protein [Limnoraphis robusta CCNP1315]MEA5547159.1 DUF4168 domain-containing protein [Limnoraphis robusta CCNP1324]